MRYNPFAYVHSEKDILKLVTTLMANTKGDGKSGDEFWEKIGEAALYSADRLYPLRGSGGGTEFCYTADISECDGSPGGMMKNFRIQWI